MKRRFFLRRSLFWPLLFLMPIIGLAGTTGKIAGTITDKESGEPLIGANVLVMGTAMGASSDMNGQYTILHVPPGLYALQVSYLGYRKVTINDVRVEIDQTARVDVALETESLELGEVVVVAQRDLIKPDVSTSVVSVTNAEIQALPVVSLSSAIGLQAGIQGELEIRGGQASEALFQVNGITLRDPRNNQPISNIALSSVKEVSVERGGFNAEYGQVRSGIINVVTKEGERAAYAGTVTLRYSSYSPKHFGISPFDKNSMWLRPYLDEAVCWTGTASGAWDKYTQDQYPDFAGWNEISRQLNSDNNPNNDLSPFALQREFLWRTRKRPATNPDYNVDAGFGGPVPLIGKQLGDLRFYSAYRRDREMLLVPMTRDDNLNWDWNLRLSADPSASMKLGFTALSGKRYTMADNWTQGSYIDTPLDVVLHDSPSELWSTGYFSPVEISHNSLSANLTHLLSTKTFYEVKLAHLTTNYDITAARSRDLTKKYEIVPGYFVDEAPFGYSPIGAVSHTGIEFGGHTCKQRDFSKVPFQTNSFLSGIVPVGAAVQRRDDTVWRSGSDSGKDRGV